MTWTDLALDESRVAMRLLRAAIHDPGVLRDLVAAGAAKEHFLAPALQVLWEAMVREHARAGRIDLTFLRAAVADASVADGDIVDLVLESPELDQGTDVLATMRTVKRRVALHHLRRLAQQVQRFTTAVDADPEVLAAHLRGEAERIVGAVDTAGGHDGRALADVVSELVRSGSRAWDTVPLGLPEVDEALDGGVPVGRCSMLMAGTSVGKSTYARHALISMARALKPSGAGILYVTFESDREEVARELVQMLAGVRVGRTELASSALASVAGALDELSGLGVIAEFSHGLTVDGLQAMVRSHKRRRKIAAVVLDYVQDLDLPPGCSPPEGHARNSRALRTFAAREHVAMLWLSQVSADAASQRDKATRLRQEDCAGSRQYAKDAPVIVALERKLDAKDPAMRNLSRASLLKNRMTGKLVEQWMKWDQATTRLQPCDENGRVAGSEPVEPEEWGDA